MSNQYFDISVAEGDYHEIGVGKLGDCEKLAAFPSAQINQGCIIESLAGVNSNVSVGACSIIKMGVLINHNSVVAEGYC